MSRHALSLVLSTVFAVAAGFDAHPAHAQEGFNPLAPPETSGPPPRKTSPTPLPGKPLLPPMDGRLSGSGPAVPAASSTDPQSPADSGDQAVNRDPPFADRIDESSQAVERVELTPVMAADGSGLPYELWQGLTVADLEALLAKLEIPPRSPSLHMLWRRLITSDVTPPSGATNDEHFMALRVEALDRSGLLAEAADALARNPVSASNPLLRALAARAEIGLGHRDTGCEATKGGTTVQSDLPARLKGEMILVAGYCAAAAGNLEAAGLQAGLAREAGLAEEAGPDALDAVSTGTKPRLAKGQKLSLLDWRIIELAGAIDPNAVAIADASPSLLATLALDPKADPALRLQAGEAAARLNAISTDELAGIYRDAAPPLDLTGQGLGSADGISNDLAPRRAALFKAAEFERTPQKKARLIRSFLDSARRAGLYWTALRLMAKPADTIQPVAEIGWFTETAIETSLAAGSYERVRSWASFGATADQAAAPGSLDHWLALADIADPALTSDRTAHLASVEQLATRGRLDPELLHRFATVLDALDINVPIPLWDLASRTAQPNTGHLPDTGILTALQDAAKRKEFGRTVLLAMQALGPSGAEGAHMIALGDSIRALKRAGLDADARRLGLEALFASWPRSLTN